MVEPMSEVDFLRSMFMSFVKNREEARKLMRADPDFNWVSDEWIDEILREHYQEGKKEFGYADLALAAIRTGKLESFNEVLIVDKARKKRQARLDYADDTPAIKSRMEDLLCEAPLCDDENKREQILQDAYKVYDRIEARKNPNIDWEDYFSANDYADKIRILQEIYDGALNPAEIVEFLDMGDDDKEAVMQKIYRAEKARIADYGDDDYDYGRLALERLHCEDEIVMRFLDDKIYELEEKRIKEGDS